MQIIESSQNKTEVFLKFKDWSVRFWISGRASPQERRQVGMAISDMISKTLGEVSRISWITHPSGYRANIQRDENRDIPFNRALKQSTGEERTGFEIRIRRLKSGLSQRALSKRSSVDLKQLSRIERGQVRMRDSTYMRIHEALDELEAERSPKSLKALQST